MSGRASSDEPSGRDIVAVEPSGTLIDQRPKDSAPVVQASAPRLPFRDRTFVARWPF